jgi:hypothetical protein
MCDMGLLRHIRATRAPFIEMTNEQLEMEWNLNKKDNLLFAKALLSRQAATLAALKAAEELAIIKEDRKSKKRRNADIEEQENTRKMQLKQKAELELKLLKKKKDLELKLLLEKVDLLMQTIDYLSMNTNSMAEMSRVFRVVPHFAIIYITNVPNDPR